MSIRTLITVLVFCYSAMAHASPYIFLLLAGYTQPTAFTWTGKAGTSNFSTPGNWWGGVTPGTNDVAIFDYRYCSVHCNVTLDNTVNVKGVLIRAQYPGTITQSAGVPVTVGNNGWSQGGGAFVGSNSAADSITVGYDGLGAFNVSGGTFKSTSGKLIIKGDAFTLASSSFDANGGNVTFANDRGCCGQSTTIKPGNNSLVTVTFTPYWQATTFDLAGSTLNITGNLIIDDAGRNGGGMNLNNGTVNVSGDVLFTGIGYGINYGTVAFNMIGPLPQTISGNGGLPNLTLSSSNTLTISGNLDLAGSFVVSSGSVTTTGSTVTFKLPCGGSYDLNIGANNLNNLGIVGNCGNPGLNVVGTATVLGNLTLSSSGNINGGGMNLHGNLTAGSSWSGGTSTITLVGSGTQTVTGGGLPSLTIASSGSVNLSGAIGLVGSLIYSSGSLNSGTSTVTFYLSCGGGYTLDLGSQTLNNLAVSGNCNNPYLSVTGTATVNGTLDLTNYGRIENGTLAVSGNVNGGNAWNGGTGTIRLVGTGAQSVTGTYMPSIEVASTGTVTFTGTVSLMGNLKYTSGTFSGGTSTTVFQLPCGGGYSLNFGSQVLNNLSVIGDCNNPAVTITGTANVGGALNLSRSGNVNGGIIAVSGNVTIAEWSGGTSAISFVGSSQQTVSGPTIGTFPSGNITVNNPSGIKLASNMSWNGSTQSTTVTSGSINLGGSGGTGGFNLTLQSLSLNGNTLTKNAGVLTVNNSVAGTGSLYGGTVNP